MAYNLRTNEILLHGKFQPPNFNGVAVHRLQTEVQTKRGLSNICLDVSLILNPEVKIFLSYKRPIIPLFSIFILLKI